MADTDDQIQQKINEAAQQAGTSPVEPPPIPPTEEPKKEQVIPVVEPPKMVPSPIPDPILPKTEPTGNVTLAVEEIDKPTPSEKPIEIPKETPFSGLAEEVKEKKLSDIPKTTEYVPLIVKQEEKKPSGNPPIPPKKQKKKINPAAIFAPIIFLLISLPIAVYYISQNTTLLTEMRGRATCTCYPEDTKVCSGEWFHPCPGITCQGTKTCIYDDSNPRPTARAIEACSHGGETKNQCCPPEQICQQGEGGAKTGYLCSCVAAAGNQFVWQCNERNTTRCPTTEGANLPGKLRDSCGTNRYVYTENKRCVQKVTQAYIDTCANHNMNLENCTISITDAFLEAFSAARFTCPNNFTTQNTSTGCAENRENLNGKTACLVNNFCGNQQLDVEGEGCTLSSSDKLNCDITEDVVINSPTPSTVPPTTTPPTITSTVGPTTPPNSPTPEGPTTTPGSPYCDASCDSDSNCPSGLVCADVEGIKRCRNSSCTSESDCNCPIIPTVTRYLVNGPTSTVGPSSTPTTAPTPKIPVAGVPNIFGAITAGGGILLLLLGLLL